MYSNQTDFTNSINKDAKTTAGVYGSTRAASFIKDAKEETDYLDVVVIGDSNTLYTSMHGFTGGLTQGLGDLGMYVYATPLFHTSSTDDIPGNVRGGGSMGVFNSLVWTGRAVTGTSSNVIYTLEGKATDDDEYAQDALEDIGLATMTAFDTTTLGSHLKPHGFTRGTTYVPQGGVWGGFGNGPTIGIGSRSIMVMGNGLAGQDIQYRVVAYKTPGGDPSRKLHLQVTDANSINTQLALASPSNHSATAVVETLKLDYTTGIKPTSFDTDLNVQIAQEAYALNFCFDGRGGGDGTQYRIVGPAVVLGHSVIHKNTPGYSVTNMACQGGRTTAELKTMLDNSPGYVEYILKELRERQVEAGGKGRVLVFLNTGINEAATANPQAYLDALKGITDRFFDTWTTTLGYDHKELAFLLTISHPHADAGINGVYTTQSWLTQRPINTAAAVSWAKENMRDGRGVCFFDIEKVYTGTQLLTEGLFDVTSTSTGTTPSTNCVHLKSTVNIAFTQTPQVANTAGNLFPVDSRQELASQDSGYVRITNKMLSSLIASVS